MTDTPTREQQQQAQSFFKVLVRKKMSVPDMANVMQHMGAMLVEYADTQLTEAREGYKNDPRVDEAEFKLRMGMVN